MPRLMLDLSRDEFDRLRDRAVDELRHPRDTARLILRTSLGLPPRHPEPTSFPASASSPAAIEREKVAGAIA